MVEPRHIFCDEATEYFSLDVIRGVAGIDEVGKLRVHLQPAVCVPGRFVSHSVRLVMPGAPWHP
jgi:hypothetical protein